jgi:hypothetical protein
MSGLTCQQIVFVTKLVLSVNRSAVCGLGLTPLRLATWTDQLLSTISKRLLPLVARLRHADCTALFPLLRPHCGSVIQGAGLARVTSAIEYRIRGHGRGVVILNASEQHITAKQDDCQQAISKVGSLSGTVIAHFAGIPGLANHRSALCGRPCEFNFHAGCARPGE